VLMHWRAHSVDMQQHTAYDDVVTDVMRELGEQLDAARQAGVDPARIAVDPGMLPVVARLGTPYVVMHWRAHSREMQEHTDYADVVEDVVTELREQLDTALAAGVDPARIAIDPGIGFSKTPDQNWDVLGGMERLHGLGHPVLIATSRKRFLGTLLADPSGALRSADAREDGTTATSALAAAAGAWCIRTHAVRPTLDAVRVAGRWAGGGRG